ncbi:hypothetical protein [Chamaesiphon sp.]|uniref:hypothetical protein n=1 Tax=Chamaesiphon sp. TaxID=2814140 RepID=UPI003592FB50
MDISESIERAISAYFAQWLFAHPYLAWTIAHPLLGLGLLLLLIFSLWGLIKAIGRAIEQVWLFLLTTPFRLLQPIFGLIWRSIRRVFGQNNVSDDRLISPAIPTPSAERIDRILDRLQCLRQEQDILLQELATLASSTSVATESGAKSDTHHQNVYAKILK